MNNQFNEAIALARLVAEKTGVSTETALTHLAKLAPQEETEYSTIEEVMDYIKQCPNRAQGWTGKELKRAFPTIKLPSKSKIVAAAFRHAEYLSGDKREGSVIWRKP